MTREYPPNVYGGAGVHVEYLSRELAKKIEVEVHCWGDQKLDQGNLHVRGSQPWAAITEGTQEKFKTALETLSLNLAQMTTLAKSISFTPIPGTFRWPASWPRSSTTSPSSSPPTASNPSAPGRPNSSAAATP